MNTKQSYTPSLYLDKSTLKEKRKKKSFKFGHIAFVLSLLGFFHLSLDAKANSQCPCPQT